MNEFIAKVWKALSILPQRPKIALAVVVGILIGIILHWGLSPAHEEHAAQASGEQTAEAVTVWTCSMHPEIRLHNPGLCPKCNMELIPLLEQADDEMSSVREFTTSEYAKALMDIETATVERKFVPAKIRMVGKVEYDETRVEYITSWVPGRLDRLFVDYTGVPVKKGDHMVYLYSPELLSAQEELIQAAKAVQNIEASSSDLMREVTAGTLEASREKLRLWGLTVEQVAEIEKRGTASDHITIFSPASGIVIHKNAQEGMYVKTGTRIYTVADLSHVWVKLDAYESDLMWLRYGQEVEFATVSYPGELFKGTISFIDPVLNSATRTIKIRVDVPNEDGKLKPEMFVKAVVKAQVATSGKVMDPKLAGKWICPMHPSVIKDAPDKCDICEMPLVQTETLGYVSTDPEISEKPLVIPVTAALITGTRAVVYVELPDRDKPTYQGREIVLGPRAGSYYIVRSGLKEGDRVVTKGNFKIDSALQIQAKPSMMSPETKSEPSQAIRPKVVKAVNPEFRKQLEEVFKGYFSVQKRLAKDKFDEAVAGISKIKEALADVDMKLLSDTEHHIWMKEAGALEKIISDASKAKNIEVLRLSFTLLSEQMPVVAREFGPPGKSALYQLKCPMAFNNRGATWLQQDENTRNPYFGSTMLKCGSVIEVIEPAGDKDSGGPQQ